MQREAPRTIRGAVALIGFSAVIGQIVLMRELIVVFGGNEISLGIMLATWLFWTALGSYLGSRLKLGENNARRVVALIEFLLGVSLLPTIWLLRASRSMLQTVAGELIGPVPMMLTSLLCLSVFCALSGCLFVVGTRMYAQACGLPARVATSSAYLLEAAGSAGGGILASVVLLRFCNSFQIAVVVLLVNVSMAAILLLPMRRPQAVATAMAIAMLAAFLIVWVAPRLQASSQARLWRGFRLLGSRDSIYGNLAVTETGNIRSLYDNGVILANAPDEAAAEEAVHYALLEHPAPRHVLLIGGGLNGSIAQALKHPTIKQIDYVELDPALVSIARQLFVEQAASFSDPRVRIHYTDGTALSEGDPGKVRRDHSQRARSANRAVEPLLHPRILCFRRRPPRSRRTVGATTALLGGLHQPRPGSVSALHSAHAAAGVSRRSQFIPGETIHFFAAMQPDVLTENPQMLICQATGPQGRDPICSGILPALSNDAGPHGASAGTTPAVAGDTRQPRFCAHRVLLRRRTLERPIPPAYARWLRAAASSSFVSVVVWVCLPLLLAAGLLASGRLESDVPAPRQPSASPRRGSR